MLLMAGIGLSIFMVSTRTSVQTRVPGEFRSRVMAIWGMNYSVVLPWGNCRWAPSAVILGGVVMLVVVAVMAVANRAMRDLGPQGPPE